MSRDQKFSRYRSALDTLAARTRTPLPSLLASFAVLHEATAIAPLVTVFFAARALGAGERAVLFVRGESAGGSSLDDPAATSSTARSWWGREQCIRWLDEGEQWAARVGRRYGLFGYEKKAQRSQPDAESSADPVAASHVSQRIAGDVANAVLAYGVTKALLPARIGLSLYLAPAFSRGVIEPCRGWVARMWRRR